MKRIYLFTSLLLAPLWLAAQDVTLNVDYPQAVNAGQQFMVSWSVNSGGGEFNPPPFTGFIKLMGPQTSYNSSTQIINGKMSQSTSYTYTYYLQADQPGSFTIQPAQFKLKGKTYSSEPMKIEVVAGATTAKQSGNQAAQNDGEAGQDVESAGDNIFVNLALSRKELYIGEHIIATVKVYTRVNLAGINDIKFPSFNGFLKSDIPTPQLTSLKQESVNGVIYGTGVVQQFILYPQTTGEITIDPVQLTVLLQQKSGQSDPFFGDFFSTVQTVPKAVASRSVKIKVKALPGVRPADFSGVVGNISMKATLSKSSVKANDAVNLKIVLSGKGNLKVAASPELKLSPDIEKYEPDISDDLKNTSSGTTGEKTFDFLLIPRHSGEFTIPPVTYTYFNITSGRYETLSSDEFKLNVSKGDDQNSAITVYGSISKEDVKYLGKDIRFISTNTGTITRADKIIVRKQSFYMFYIIAILAFAAIIFTRRERIKRNSDLMLVRNRKAGKVAIKRLQNAATCLNEHQTDRFYEEILKAIYGYLSDKLSIPVAELTRNNAIEALSAFGTEQQWIDILNHILDTCEYARFSPAAASAEAESIYEDASQFIKTVENLIN